MPLSIKLDPEAKEVSLDIDNYGVSQKKDLDFLSMLTSLKSTSYFNSGLMPTHDDGMISLRQAGGFTQVVYQEAAGERYVHWGAYEGHTGSKLLLAMPYRIIVMDWHDMNPDESFFIGARHFYSPTPISGLDQRLYHTNLPNTNCRGYNGTSVGWVCLYGHSFGDKKKSFWDKVHHVVVRMSGDEPYNDANMSGTDGPRTYELMYRERKPKTYNRFRFMWDKELWAKKTEKEGYEWICDPKLLMPIRVTSMDDQYSHANNGLYLTLDMAIKGNYSAYYEDPWHPRPYNLIDRASDNISDQGVLKTAINSIINNLTKS